MSTNSANAVREALDKRCKAVVAGDVAYLETILAPEFRHIHATGKIEPRAVYLGTFKQGVSRFSKVDPADLVVNAYETSAVAAGDIFIGRVVDGKETGRTSRFVSVWHNNGTIWQLVYWQMTAIQ